jgi:hypothetical protein
VEEQARSRHRLHRLLAGPVGHHHPLARPVHNQVSRGDLIAQLVVALRHSRELS